MRRQTKLAIIVTTCLIVIVSLALLLRIFPSFWVMRVHGKDMEPTLHDGYLILVTRRLDPLRRGDILSFRYPADPSQTFIKRVVGLPGEIIAIQDGKVLVNGQDLQEDYLDPQLNRFPHTWVGTKIPEGKYYVMGDNRDSSNDSRFWGPVPKELIQGKVAFHY